MRGSVEICGCFPTGRHYAGIAHLLKLKVVGLAEEWAAETEWLDVPIVMIDTETTGRDAATDRIVEIGLIVGRSGEIAERHNWLVNPGVPIPKEASDVHHITDDDVRDAPRIQDIAKDLLAILARAVPAAYNAGFDRAFVMEELRRAGVDVSRTSVPAVRSGVEWIDPLVWARLIHREEKSRALGEVAARLGISLENAHRASDDAEAALRVMYAFSKEPQVPKTYGGLIQEQRRLARIQDEELRQWRQNRPT